MNDWLEQQIEGVVEVLVESEADSDYFWRRYWAGYLTALQSVQKKLAEASNA